MGYWNIESITSRTAKWASSGPTWGRLLTWKPRSRVPQKILTLTKQPSGPGIKMSVEIVSGFTTVGEHVSVDFLEFRLGQDFIPLH